MPKIKTWFWGLFLMLLFQCARIVCTLLKLQVRGALLAVWCEGRILLIQKSYRRGWSIPGGLCKKRETWEQAAVRETFEEVGLRVNTEHLKFIAEFPGDLGPQDRVHLFDVEVSSPVQVVIDQREIIEAEFVVPQEALNRDIHQHIVTYLQAQEAPDL